MRRNGIALSVWVAVSLSAAGCSSGQASGVASLRGAGAASTSTAAGGAGTATKDAQGQFADFAQCMRVHGVDMKDPTVNADGTIDASGGGSPRKEGSSPEFARAQTACAGKRPKLGGDAADNGKMQDQLVAYATCMRAHGVDMPDPKAVAGGGLTIAGGTSDFRKSPNFPSASAACASALSGLVPVGSAP